METGEVKFKVGQKVVINDENSSYHKTHGVIDEIHNAASVMPTYRVLLGAPATPYWYLERLLEAFEETSEPVVSSLKDKLPVLTGKEIRKEESGEYTAFRQEIDTRYVGPETTKLPIWMAEGFNGTRDIQSTPKTVGDVMWEYMKLKKQSIAFELFLDDMNQRMNEYADSAGLCSAYDEAVEELNAVFQIHLPHFPFRFSGRSYQYAVTVQRQRTIVETAVVYIEGPKDASLADLEYDAAEQAAEMDDGEWETIDDTYEYGDIEAIDHHTTD
jgi:hypothetical protein